MPHAPLKNFDTVPQDMVFDPLLPRTMLADLRSGSGSLVLGAPGTRPASHRFRRERAVLGAAVMSGALALTLAVELTTGPVYAWIAGVVAVFGYIPPNKVDRATNGREHWRAGWNLVGSSIYFLFAVVPLSLWLADEVWVTPEFAFLHPVAYGFFVFRRENETTHVVGRDHVIMPHVLVRHDRRRLAEVQDARERVREAQRLLGPAFDAAPVLTALHEAEWDMASRMREVAPLAAEVDRLGAEAATERVRDALRPQTEAVLDSREADQRLCHRVSEYIEPVDRAVRAHREWAQLLQVADSAAAHAGLLRRPDGDAPAIGGAPGLDDLGLEAARLAREELTAKAVESNVWLLTALDDRGGDSPKRPHPGG